VSHDFFQRKFDVDEIRNFGLFQFKNKNLVNDDFNYYPGVRSLEIGSIYPELFDYIHEKLIFHIKKLVELEKIQTKKKYNLRSFYHLTTSIHKCGFIHRDSASFAGVIYLNPKAPKNSGTKICKLKKQIDENEVIFQQNELLTNFKIASVTHDKEIISLFCDEKEKFNKQYFDTQYNIENTYNSAILYPGKYYHSPGEYFGKTLEDSRLCIVLFFNFID
jgi:hypothetical protein